MRHFQLILLMLIICPFTIGCSGNPSILDTNVSQPPSWNNIVPGYTPRSDAIIRLQNISDIEQSTLDVNQEGIGYRKGSISWGFVKDSSDIHGEIYTKNNIVWLILITPEENAVDFEEVIDLYGEPEKVFAGTIPNQPMVTWLLYTEIDYRTL